MQSNRRLYVILLCEIMVSHPEIYKNLVNFVHLQYEFITHSTVSKVSPFELPESTP